VHLQAPSRRATPLPDQVATFEARAANQTDATVVR